MLLGLGEASDWRARGRAQRTAGEDGGFAGLWLGATAGCAEGRGTGGCGGAAGEGLGVGAGTAESAGAALPEEESAEVDGAADAGGGSSVSDRSSA